MSMPVPWSCISKRLQSASTGLFSPVVLWCRNTGAGCFLCWLFFEGVGAGFALVWSWQGHPEMMVKRKLFFFRKKWSRSPSACWSSTMIICRFQVNSRSYPSYLCGSYGKLLNAWWLVLVWKPWMFGTSDGTKSWRTSFTISEGNSKPQLTNQW